MSGDDNDAPPSKSQRKRDALDLQALAESLVALPESQLEALPLDEALDAAIMHARALSRGAYRRQLRYLGRLLRETDVAPIRSALAACQGASHAEKARFKRLERWRERLMAEGDPAVAALLVEFPGADAQQLRQLLRNAHKERDNGRAPRNHRLLFRFLREL